MHDLEKSTSTRDMFGSMIAIILNIIEETISIVVSDQAHNSIISGGSADPGRRRPTGRIVVIRVGNFGFDGVSSLMNQRLPPIWTN